MIESRHSTTLGRTRGSGAMPMKSCTQNFYSFILLPIWSSTNWALIAATVHRQSVSAFTVSGPVKKQRILNDSIPGTWEEARSATKHLSSFPARNHGIGGFNVYWQVYLVCCDLRLRLFACTWLTATSLFTVRRSDGIYSATQYLHQLHVIRRFTDSITL